MDIIEWLTADAVNRITVYPPDEATAVRNMERFAADTSNVFGALIFSTGGACAENVIRVFGSTIDKNLRDISLWNDKHGSAEIIIIGDDIFGGVFAVNLSLPCAKAGNICYLAPDTLDWEDLNITLSGFLSFLKSGNFKTFYAHIPPDEYEKIKSSQVPFNEIAAVYPPQWSAEFHSADRKYSNIPADEYYSSIK